MRIREYVGSTLLYRDPKIPSCPIRKRPIFLGSVQRTTHSIISFDYGSYIFPDPRTLYGSDTVSYISGNKVVNIFGDSKYRQLVLFFF